ncbi:MAG: hypothetical protein JST44_23190 [Cyanobacteria bacterium SZAS LIN-5]|nr:hypothetical protein [Cyanobacteria bacterium SZAS LIN-5]
MTMIKQLGRKMVSKNGAALAAFAMSVFGAFPASAETFNTMAVIAECDGARDSVVNTFRAGGGMGNHFNIYVRANNPGNNGRAGYVVNRFGGNVDLINDVVVNLYSADMETAKTSTRVRFLFADGTIVDRLISEFSVNSVNGFNGYYECRYPANKLLPEGQVPRLSKIAIFVDKGPANVDLGSIKLSVSEGEWRVIYLDLTGKDCSVFPAPPK